MEYDDRGSIKGLRFVLPILGKEASFSLPVRTDALLKYCGNDRERARRVAWRQLLRWVQAQLALIDVGMVKAEEVYTPYLLESGGRTLFERMIESQFKEDFFERDDEDCPPCVRCGCLIGDEVLYYDDWGEGPLCAGCAGTDEEDISE